MRYMLLICSDDKNAPPAPRAEMEVIIQGHRRFSDELQAAGKMVVGERLRPDCDASRIRLKAGQRQGEYRRALGLADNVREQKFLAARLAACEAGRESRR